MTQMRWKQFQVSVLLIAAGLLASSTAGAQQITDFAIGAAQTGPLTAQNGSSYTFGFAARASIGSVVLPRVALRADATGIAFGRPQENILMCFSGGHCAVQWSKTLSGIFGASGSVQFDLDPHARFYASLGAGAYEESLDQTSAHAGFSGGLGVVLPLRSRRIAIEANWLQLSRDTSAAPMTALSISAVFRF